MWKFNDKELTIDEIPEKAFGFIYLITNTIDNKKYLGKKFLTKASYKTVNGKRKKCRKESDWASYYGSSDILKELINQYGKENFNREIICFCENKITLSYCEENLQHHFKVLESDDWINANIRARIYKKHIQNKIPDLSAIKSKFI